MAYGRSYYGSKRRYGNYRNRRRSHTRDVTRTAYLMGCVERGRKNADSKISASYEAGKNRQTSEKKSLY